MVVYPSFAQEMVERVRDLHTIGAHVHRDVKPSNFLLGFPDTPEQDTVRPRIILIFLLC